MAMFHSRFSKRPLALKNKFEVLDAGTHRDNYSTSGEDNHKVEYPGNEFSYAAEYEDRAGEHNYATEYINGGAKEDYENEKQY
jgi:hypothetical protein